MRFEEVLPHLRAGRRIQRSGWGDCVYNPVGFPKRFTKVNTYPDWDFDYDVHSMNPEGCLNIRAFLDSFIRSR